MRDLAELRSEINTIDAQLLDLFAKRFAIVREVGEYKKTHKLPIRDEQREQELVRDLSERAKELQLSEEFVTHIWQSIFNESYKQEK